MKKILFVFLVLIINLYAQDIYATFNIEAQKSANLAFNIGGIVKNVNVAIASNVKKGDILATLNDSDLQSGLKVAKANLNKSKISLKYAKIELERQKKLKKLIDKSTFDKYELAYESAKATVALMLANISYKKAFLDKTILRAPFDGVIFDKIIEIGDVVSGGIIKTVLKIQSKSERKLILEFDQKYWQNVKIGDTFVYKIDGSSREFKGLIYKIYPYANSSNRKIKAEVKAKDLPVGLFGNGYIKLATKK
jgi:RND family efflux transporter MFP subunit